MAVRSEDLWDSSGAEVLAFPTAMVRARAARRAAVLRARRRLGIGALVVALFLGVLAAGGMGRSAPSMSEAGRAEVTVAAGDTLWGIASRYAPDGVDLRAYVDELVELNELTGALQRGTRLRLP